MQKLPRWGKIFDRKINMLQRDRRATNRKDRPAAVFSKPDPLLRLGGYGTSDISLLPAESHETEETDKPSDHHRPSRGQWGYVSNCVKRARRQIITRSAAT
jgi:hypothetical protein